MKKSADESKSVPTFREWLAEIDDVLLGQILSNRPDTVFPDPPGITTLAGRLQIRVSISRALTRLNAVELLVLEAAAAIGGELTAVSAQAVVDKIQQCTVQSTYGSPTEGDILTALTRLRQFALVYGTDDALKVVTEVMSTLPSDWQLLPDPGVPQLTYEEVADYIDHADNRSKKILYTLQDSGGTGITRDADPEADPQRPIPKLLAAGLLVRIDNHTVRLSPTARRVLWEVGPLVVPLVPPYPTVAIAAEQLEHSDQLATANGLEVVRMMREFIDALGEQPAACLRDGSIGVRTIQRLAKDLQLSKVDVYRLAGLGLAANLLARDVVEPPPDRDMFRNYLVPTHAADDWLHAELSQRWAELLVGWWNSPWAAWLVEKPVNVLSEATFRQQLVFSKRLLIEQFQRAGQLSVEQAVAMAGFYAPLHATQIRSPQEICAEAAWIGVLTPDLQPTSMALALSQGAEEVCKATQQATPRTVDYLIAQGDMTILAPGPLAPELERKMNLLAEVESAGLASVYRITETSLRHAMDAGMSAADISELLETHTAGDLPQAISYLLADLSRQHGGLRGGPALSYIRCEDSELLTRAVEATPTLRWLAPTVAISQLPIASVLESLRRAGFQPVAEDSQGITLDARPPAFRVETPTPVHQQEAYDIGQLSKIIATIRQNSEVDTANAKKRRTSEDILGILQAAVRSGTTVTLGFVDKHGVASVRVVRPITVSGGQVDAMEASTGAIHRYQLHRITEVIVDN